jgi:hypothetical protein
MSTQAEFCGELQQVNGGTKLAVRHWVAMGSNTVRVHGNPDISEEHPLASRRSGLTNQQLLSRNNPIIGRIMKKK